MRSPILIFLICILFGGCKNSKIPQKPLPEPSRLVISHEAVDDTLKISISNKIKSPVHVRIVTPDSVMENKLRIFQPIILPAEQDTLLQISLDRKVLPKLEFKAGLGDPQKKIILQKVGLPIPKNKAVRIIQGHNGAYSHERRQSRYAIDFSLKVGDTVFAALDGYAVQVTDGYKTGGKDIRWLDFANNIVIYNPDTGLFFQYSHLVHKGAFIELGDWVRQGQPIGLSGMTGYTDVPHLHFNVLAPDPAETGLISVPVDFVEGYFGKDLQKNVIIQRN